MLNKGCQQIIAFQIMAQVINKYVWLVDTIRKAGKAGITFEDINKLWLRKDNVELSGGLEIPHRTFHKWRIAVEEMFNVAIDCRRKGGYHYFIANPEELKGHSMSNWLLETVSVSNLLMQNIALKGRVLLENVPSGLQFLPEILDAMNGNNVLSVTYKGYWHEEASTFDVHPYCVKLFKQRWYMVAFSTQRQAIRTYALDRIQALDRRTATFVMPSNFSPVLFFKNSYGVMMGSEVPSDVKIKVNAFEANYLRSLPLHHSQQEVFKCEEYSIFTYHLSPEFDFRMELLSRGDDVEVLEPAYLRDAMAEIACRMNAIYNGQLPPTIEN